ncbi:MAG TPA: hypothetical protein PKD83_13315 [Ignavibacteria bacterium]|nr:hypothetical protein [Ignavibacteria bacterium]
MNPKVKNYLDTFLEVSNSSEDLIKLVNILIETIQPPFPDFPPEVQIANYYENKPGLSPEKQSIVDEYSKKYKK